MTYWFNLRSLSKPALARLLVCALAALWACSSMVLAHEDREYALVASPAVPVRNLSLAQVRRLYLFEQRYWDESLRVSVLILEDDLRDGSVLLRTIYNFDEVGLRRYILTQLYRGDIERAPKVVTSPDILLRYVASGQGVLALVPASEVGDAMVQILTVDGLRPGDQGYPLRD